MVDINTVLISVEAPFTLPFEYRNHAAIHYILCVKVADAEGGTASPLL